MTYRFVSERKVKVQGVTGSVLVRGADQIPEGAEFANANLVRRADGFVLKVTAFFEKGTINSLEHNGKTIGLDFGVKSSLTTSEGEKIGLSVGEGDRLGRLQRELSRRRKGSSNRRKTIGLIQRECLRTVNRKRDLANKVVARLRPYSRIVIQDEQIAGWQKGLFGKRVHQSCLGLVKARLKALPQTVVLDRWIPTTKWCPDCGRRNGLSLSDRSYSCECGRRMDRDVHAAMNMAAIADLVLGNDLSVPTERREVTLTEFKAAAGRAFGAATQAWTSK